MSNKKYVLKRLNLDDKEAIKEVFVGVFTREPWNDDWSDKEQLDLYIIDLIGQGYSLTYGLYDSDELIGISMGYIKHWYSGTEYIINELCIKTERQGEGAGTFFLSEIEKAIKELGLKQIFLLTDSNVPAYHFYKKNGFTECRENVSFAKFI
ncbi:MAG: GNAT family N-acetyltransferase [Lachnospiraceae bacterium]|nr:GNAT family N-acetyltransferase [Lachnospiraceae bacterium]